MRCFNTKGFFSNLDIEYKDKAFILLGLQYHDPLIFETTRSTEEEGTFVYEVNQNPIQPISFPVFGEYSDYGGLENIIKDFNVLRIEEILEDSIENIIEVIQEITIYGSEEKQYVEKYYSYKHKLQEKAVNDILSTFPPGFRDDESKRKILNKIRKNNKEIVWCMDHLWVYKTLGRFPNQIPFDIDYLFFNNQHYLYSDFKIIWTNKKEVQPYKKELRQYFNFINYLERNKIIIRFFMGEGMKQQQENYWEEMEQYTKEYYNFVKNKLKENP